MLNITLKEVSDNKKGLLQAGQKRSLKHYLLEKVQQWINSLLEAERDECLGRDRHQRLDQNKDNYRKLSSVRAFDHRSRLGLSVRSTFRLAECLTSFADCTAYYALC